MHLPVSCRKVRSAFHPGKMYNSSGRIFDQLGTSWHPDSLGSACLRGLPALFMLSMAMKAMSMQPRLKMMMTIAIIRRRRLQKRR